MTKLTLITDRAILNKEINGMGRTIKALNTTFHRLALSSLAIAMNSGNPDVLNRFFNQLNKNDQRGFRQYLMKVQHDFTPSIDRNSGRLKVTYHLEADGKAVKRNDRYALTFTTKAGFRVVPLAQGGIMENRQRMAAFIESHLLNPVPEASGPYKGWNLWEPFYAHDAAETADDLNRQFLKGGVMAKGFRKTLDELNDPAKGLKGMSDKAVAALNKYLPELATLLEASEEDVVLRLPIKPELEVVPTEATASTMAEQLAESIAADDAAEAAAMEVATKRIVEPAPRQAPRGMKGRAAAA